MSQSPVVPAIPPTAAPSLLARLAAGYAAFFHLDEWEEDPAVRLFAWAVLLGFFARYTILLNTGAGAVGPAACWAFLPDCEAWRLLKAPPLGYSHSAFFMLMFGAMAACAYALHRRAWAAAHAALLALFLSRVYLMSVDYVIKENFDYYHVMFCVVALFLAHRRFFGRLALVAFYFLSTNSKLTPSWTLGEYFSALDLGLPLFPHGSEILMTNLVIGMEMVGSWLLFSRVRWLQRLVLAFFVLFHLYSGLLVGYLYPTTVLPPLVILFGLHAPWTDKGPASPWLAAPRTWASLPGWIAVAALVALQNVGNLIPGDQRLTLEGNFYGLYMFEANHQCSVVGTSGDKVIFGRNVFDAWSRCDPYEYWFHIRRSCRGPEGGPIAMQMDHSVNGGPFRRIVSEPNVCALSYDPLGRNAWIKDETQAEVVGWPMRNVYGRRSFPAPRGFANQPGPYSHGWLHDLAAPHEGAITGWWTALHYSILALLVLRLLAAWRPRGNAAPALPQGAS